MSMLLSMYLFCLLVVAVGAFVSPQYVTFSCRGAPPSSHQRPASTSSDDMSELYRRIDNLAASEELEGSLSSGRIMLPVLAFDSLLPNQRLDGRTTDPTFSCFLRDVGIGGLFVMTSVNHSKRMLRRNGVVTKIELVDAKTSEDNRIPTAVDFVLVGKSHCRLVGPSSGMKARVGRWRRSYDPDGEQSVLGWGEERFVDAFTNATSFDESDDGDDKDDNSLPETEWSLNEVDCAIQDGDCNDPTVLERIKAIIPLLEKWQSLASDVKTYENTHVVAASRIMKGQPGLGVDPAALIRNVKKDLGEMPSDPTKFAFWGAALMNPLPVLGVSPEIRGRVLEAPDACSRLKILHWGVQRSIRNLEGTDPL